MKPNRIINEPRNIQRRSAAAAVAVYLHLGQRRSAPDQTELHAASLLIAVILLKMPRGERPHAPPRAHTCRGSCGCLTHAHVERPIGQDSFEARHRPHYPHLTGSSISAPQVLVIYVKLISSAASWMLAGGSSFINAFLCMCPPTHKIPNSGRILKNIVLLPLAKTNRQLLLTKAGCKEGRTG